ncbi:type II secretion system F family protein [Kitasatospora cinereorecta]|uniref:Type II secretion system F family protein n=1 Tax=Kitasatospora cinereorecta TaxID=285560 RepID=A0ABW0VCB1_9ACTN
MDWVLAGLPVVAGGAAVQALDVIRRRRLRLRVARCLSVDAPPPRRSARSRLPRAGQRLTVERCLPAIAGLGAAALVGGVSGLALGILAGLAVRRWLPRVRSPAARATAAEQEGLIRQLALTSELLAACLGSCSSPAQAAAVVAESVDAPMRGRLASVAAQLSLGAAPEACWEQLAADCPPLGPLAQCLVRTSVSGAPPAAALTGLAQSQRVAAMRAAHARVRRAGVLATAPLGLCFLPAFVLIGVAPVVMGLTSLFAQHV